MTEAGPLTQQFSGFAFESKIHVLELQQVNIRRVRNEY